MNCSYNSIVNCVYFLLITLHLYGFEILVCGEENLKLINTIYFLYYCILNH